MQTTVSSHRHPLPLFGTALLLCWASLTGACATSQEAQPRPAPSAPQQDPFEDDLLGNFTQVGTTSIDRDLEERQVSSSKPQDEKTQGRHRGRLDQQVAERTLRRYEPTIRACYDAEGNAGVAGKITMALVVRPGGRVSRAQTLRNTTRSRTLARCVERRLRRVVFSPGPVGGTARYEYAYLFGY